jgi:hypothetical protein
MNLKRFNSLVKDNKIPESRNLDLEKVISLIKKANPEWKRMPGTGGKNKSKKGYYCLVKIKSYNLVIEIDILRSSIDVYDKSGNSFVRSSWRMIITEGDKLLGDYHEEYRTNDLKLLFLRICSSDIKSLVDQPHSLERTREAIVYFIDGKVS